MTFELAKKLMEERGYSMHSYEANKTGAIFCKQLTEEITVHAQVRLKVGSDTVQLSYCGLKYVMEITTNEIQFTHKDFHKYERGVLLYALQCNDVNHLFFDFVNGK